MVTDREAYRRSCGVPIHTPRRIAKARKKRAHAMTVADVRAYVFARERDLCRCCRKRRADSMHEIIFRSQQGKISKTNSIAVCGDGVRGCHGFLQRHEIDVFRGPRGAEETLTFSSQTPHASDWLGLKDDESIESSPMVNLEMAE